MPASGRLGLQTDACARTLPPPSSPLFALVRLLLAWHPFAHLQFLLGFSLSLSGEKVTARIKPRPPLVPHVFLHKVLMGQVVVVWRLVCAVAFLCLLVFFFLPSLIPFVSIRVSFLFPSRTSKHVTAPPQVHLLGRRPLIVEFSQTEDCAFKCSMRLCVRMSVCMRVLHCFSFSAVRERLRHAHACVPRWSRPPLPPDLACFVPLLTRGWCARRFLCATNSPTDSLSVARDWLGGWRRNVLEWAYCKQTFVHCSRIWGKEKDLTGLMNPDSAPAHPVSWNPTHSEAFQRLYNTPSSHTFFAQAFHLPPSFTQTTNLWRVSI